MKKLLSAAVLSLLAVGLNTGSASAWTLFHHCCQSCTKVCITPYNAFSPVCFGTLSCNGCIPMTGGCGPGLPSSPYAPFGDMEGGGESCGGLGCLPAPGSLLTAPPSSGSGSGAATPPGNFQAPQPQPLPNNTTSQMWPNPMQYNSVQWAGYRQGYNYNPAGYSQGYNYGPVPMNQGYNYGQMPMYPPYYFGQAPMPGMR
jgi:hypothetical protein